MTTARRAKDDDETDATEAEPGCDSCETTETDSAAGSKSSTKAKPVPKKAASFRMATTRLSLLERIKDPENRQSWDAFFEIYNAYIQRLGRRRGLDAQRAEDLGIVVLMEVNKRIGKFKYDPEKKHGFRKWLSTIVRCKGIDMWRVDKRHPKAPQRDPDSSDEKARTSDDDKIPDPSDGFDEIWEKEEAKAILKIAKRITKAKVSLRQWQLFECRVLRDWQVERICQTLGVTANMVNIAKHRVLPVYQEACVEAKERLDRGPLAPVDKKALEDTLPLPSYAKPKSKGSSSQGRPETAA